MPTITGWPTPASTLNVGATLSLTCTPAATGGKPDTFKWYKDDQPLTSTGGKYEVTVALTDAGTYKCQATNDDGSAVSTPSTLTVKSKWNHKFNNQFCCTCILNMLPQFERVTHNLFS